ALARLGPVGDTLRAVGATLADPAMTLVCIVSTPEELAVRETIELHRELAHRLGLPVGPAIVNAVPPRRFSRGDEELIARLEAAGERYPERHPHRHPQQHPQHHAQQHPWIAAARFMLERRREAVAQVQALRRALGAAPVRLPFLFAGPEAEGGIDILARALAHAALAARPFPSYSPPVASCSVSAAAGSARPRLPPRSPWPPPAGGAAPSFSPSIRRSGCATRSRSTSSRDTRDGFRSAAASGSTPCCST